MGAADSEWDGHGCSPGCLGLRDHGSCPGPIRRSRATKRRKRPQATSWSETWRQAQERALPDAVAAALTELAHKAVAPGKSVLLYNITFEDQGLPSPMGRYLENLALTSATSARLFTLYSRARFDAAVKAKGVSIGDLKGEPVDFVLSGMFFSAKRGCASS